MITPINPDRFEQLFEQVVAALKNSHTRLVYQKGLKEFVSWWRNHGEFQLDRSLVESHIDALIKANFFPSTINQRLSAIRKIVSAAADGGLLDLAPARDILRITGLPKGHLTVSRALSVRQAETLINAPHEVSLKGKRDRALLGLLVGCALRSGEVVRIQVEDLGRRNGHWILKNVVGTRGITRIVVVPDWAKFALDEWIEASQVRSGAVLRAVDRRGNIAERPLSAHSVLPIVTEYGRSIGIEVNPRDLRRTCAQLCRTGGGELEQIQLLLGHASIQTTERYLGGRRTVASAPNGRLRMKWRNQQIAS